MTVEAAPIVVEPSGDLYAIFPTHLLLSLLNIAC